MSINDNMNGNDAIINVDIMKSKSSVHLIFDQDQDQYIQIEIKINVIKFIES